MALVSLLGAFRPTGSSVGSSPTARTWTLRAGSLRIPKPAFPTCSSNSLEPPQLRAVK